MPNKIRVMTPQMYGYYHNRSRDYCRQCGKPIKLGDKYIPTTGTGKIPPACLRCAEKLHMV